ncbi:FRG domain-containing protein [Pseudoalteromonas gelatinilytica]|uniref:FRG domain-containing protein n=1 Tax=Pseudoalteromonas gelatinilytica TaxID=1703256 RepID=UPI001601320B|nr:FRG domain-containing protein [Pseudoalteromonas profundi]
MEEIELRDWEHFREYVAQEFGGKNSYIFRGHADRNWKLESTLTRLAHRVSEDITPKLLESAQLKNFQVRIRGLRGTNPQLLDDNGLWSLGQHYGLCTPLLDWTESVYIASYFAFEHSESCQSGWRTVYALNRVGLMSTYSEMKNEGLDFIEPLYDDNKRITAQAGIFTKIPTGTDLESWLAQRGLERFLIKLHIENYCRLEAINDLKLMNIIGASIYPDLHGASQTCNMYIETLSDNHELEKSVKEFTEWLKESEAVKP